jgi:peptide/nickel transport system ATP-binding protein
MIRVPLLEVSSLSISFAGDGGRMTQAVNDVSFSIAAGKTLGIVGESGCGKSVTSLAIMRLLPANSARVSGRITFEGANLLDLPERTMRGLRGNRLAMIFQEPMTSLNPSYTVGNQIAETLTCHRRLSRREARRQAIELLREVRIPSPESLVNSYPHKLSGGMRQRVAIAMALACQPALLIADEPTTALDVTIQAQMLELLRLLKARTGAAIMLISHDLGVVSEICDEVAVMYAGQIVERAPAGEVFARPQHPYTIGLLGALPSLSEKRGRLAAIPGMVPAAGAYLEGCRFSPRCPFVQEDCRRSPPPLRSIAPGHHTRCLRSPLEKLVA